MEMNGVRGCWSDLKGFEVCTIQHRFSMVRVKHLICRLAAWLSSTVAG